MSTPFPPSSEAITSEPSSRPRKRVVLAAALALVILVGGFAAYRAQSFLHSVTGFSNPFQEAQEAFRPAPGSIAWKLNHKEQVNLLLLGYGGAENDAPWLTDSMVVVSLDPASGRVMQVSIPRDLQVKIDAFQNAPPVTEKVNTAYSVAMDTQGWTGQKSQFRTGKDRGGRLAEQTVTAVTGLKFDGYLAADFKAFRDVVDAMGGIDVCLDGPLDDYQYPDYHDGFVKGGIHFQKGCQHINGEQALQLARSRHAKQPAEASDFGRSRRQQLLLSAIRKQAASVNALTKVPQLMDALQKDFSTDLDLNNLRALQAWTSKLQDNAIGHAAITVDDLVTDQCSSPAAYLICPLDPSWRMMHQYFANLFVAPSVVTEKAPVQIANGSRSLAELGDRVSLSLKPLGLQVEAPQRVRSATATTVYDYSGGHYPETTRWLQQYFGATVVQPAAGQPSPTPQPPAGGLVVVLGHDYALRWLGQSTA
ncbi:MAG: LCP family protein [Candidatus Dormibacter sp.]|uniref:LCP family protein n=1 Tax=Candidatus Dormibacter sp. TaxID=2973982 RepID=UPI000DB7DB8A|nr:MAG: hypothetical protein DLM66_05510 [Candidatus Dormibacteraeota bacterium]